MTILDQIVEVSKDIERMKIQNKIIEKIEELVLNYNYRKENGKDIEHIKGMVKGLKMALDIANGNEVFILEEIWGSK